MDINILHDISIKNLGASNRIRLRSAIHSNHLRAENIWVPDGKFTTLEHYETFLEALLFAHKNYGLPAARARTDADDIDEENGRIIALSQDLCITDGRPPSIRAMSESYAWGVSYVLNGSALGAATMLKTGYIHANWPHRYMNTARAYATSGRLARFFQDLDYSDINIDDATRGASMVFSQLAKRRSLTPAASEPLAKDTG